MVKNAFHTFYFNVKDRETTDTKILKLVVSHNVMPIPQFF